MTGDDAGALSTVAGDDGGPVLTTAGGEVLAIAGGDVLAVADADGGDVFAAVGDDGGDALAAAWVEGDGSPVACRDGGIVADERDWGPSPTSAAAARSTVATSAGSPLLRRSLGAVGAWSADADRSFGATAATSTFCAT